MTSSNRQIARASVIVIAAFAVSRLMGLARDMVITAQLGTTDAADAYLAAFRVPDLIFTLTAGGALASAFIPTFTAYMARDDEASAWRLTSAIINLLLVTTSAVAVVAALLAPQLVGRVLAPGFSLQKQALAIPLVRVMLVSPVIFGISGLMMGVLNARQQFLLPGLAPAAYNMGIILGALALVPTMGPIGAALGAVVGAGLHLLVQLPGLLRVGMRYMPVLSLREPGVRQVLRLMGPRVFGLAVVQINFFVETNLASWLGSGAVAALNYAWRVMMLSQGIFAQSVATAAFPTFAEQAAHGRHATMRASLAATLQAIMFVALPAATGLLALRMPLVTTLFERGRFQASSTELVALALAFYAPGLIAHSGIEILVRAFYAMHDTRTPVSIGVAAMLTGLALYLSLIGPLGMAGLALASTSAAFVEMTLLLVAIRSRLGGLGAWRDWQSTGRAALAALLMGVGVQAMLAVVPLRAAIVQTAAGAFTGVLLYGGASLLLGIPQARAILGLAGKWIGRRRQTADS